MIAIFAPFQIQAAPDAIITEFRDDEILTKLPNTATEIFRETDSPKEAGDRLQMLITQARASGDPRYLGYAQTLINRWPDEQLTERLRVLRATLRQSLHQFDSARADLEQVLSSSSDNQQRIQARLTLANLE
ncbi:MAG: hypothetical protein GY740_18745, partial [Gammaproteobacteria bacterium]|nr:hypothetical protein [Gammaproteobacteria bacterium]